MDRRSFIASLAATQNAKRPGATNRSGLEPHSQPLTLADCRHALRRCTFGAEPAAAASWVGRTATEFADSIVDEAVSLPLPVAPSWVDHSPPGESATDSERSIYLQNNGDWLLAYRIEWLRRMAAHGLAERMALIWHNFFVTGASTYVFAVYAQRYVSLLRTHGLGNFKTFVYDVGLDPAMLIYLDGVTNRAGAANENYARELLELFTMGPIGPDGTPNYTESDIQEIARALTGWDVSPTTLTAVFTPELFDDGEKTFLGRTGAFNYDDLINILFETREREIAHFVCGHLYKSLVFAEPDDTIVAAMADQLIAEEFELAPVVRTLVASAHFFDPSAQGAQIKSPIDYGLALYIDMGITDVENTLLTYRAASEYGQDLLEPPNVAGWPGHHTWINTTTLPNRWRLSETVFSGRGGGVPNLIPFAETVHDATDGEAVFHLPAALVQAILPMPVEWLDIPEITDDFGGDLINIPVPSWVLDGPPHVRNLAKIFLGGAPWYEWSLYAEGANSRLVNFVRSVVQYPEFQLL